MKPPAIHAVLLLHLLATAVAAPPAKDSAERDYRDDLPRIKPTEPAEAVKTFRAAPGFRVELVAAEPLVVDPIAMSFDADGRLYVIEMRGYSENPQDNLGRVRRLVDSDGDGRMDRGTVFADGFSWPTAIICSRGGVYVAAAPDIWFLKDTSGDGLADVRTRVFTGFGRSNVQGLVNSFRWGLDNRIHGATSSSGASVRPADKPLARPLVLRGRDFAFDPLTHAIQATSGGGQHGLSFDRWGRKFVCSNSNHLQQVMFEDRYLARNADLAAPSPRAMIAADGPQAPVFRASPVEPWRIVRTRLRVKGIVPGPVEGGGTAAGYFTGATGATMYCGNAWPREYLDWAIIGDVGSNLVHRKRLDPAGLQRVARRVDERSEFLTSTDIWFRPVQFANAPDGSLVIADMYREVIEHPKSLPPVIKKHLDLNSGRDRGRIYRVVPAGFEQPPPPRLAKASTADLAAALDHANGWHRRTAARLLYERQDRRPVAALDRLITGGRRPEGRIAALCALDGLSALDGDVILAALGDKHPQVRRHAVRLAERVLREPAVRERLVSMTGDDDLEVRYQLAFTLGEMTGGPPQRALAALLRRDGEDRWMRLAVLSSLSNGAGNVAALLAADKEFRSTKPAGEILETLAALVGVQNRPSDVAALLRVLDMLPAEEKPLAQRIVRGLARGGKKHGAAAGARIAAAGGGRAGALLAEMLAAARRTALDEQSPLAERVEAVRSLGLSPGDDVRDVLLRLVAPSQPQAIQTAALSSLAESADPRIAQAVLKSLPSLSPHVRGRALDVLFSRRTWTLAALDAVRSKQLAVADVGTARLKLLENHPEETIRSAAKALRRRLAGGPRSDVLAAYQSALTRKGDAARGRAVFKKVCSACHRVEGIGRELGPSLITLRSRGAEAVLLNVLDPNREVNPQYVNYVVVTTDGRSLSGMIVAETATSITLARGEGEDRTILRGDIDQIRGTGASLMPEGLEQQVDPPSMADLLEYLEAAGK